MFLYLIRHVQSSFAIAMCFAQCLVVVSTCLADPVFPGNSRVPKVRALFRGIK